MYTSEKILKTICLNYLTSFSLYAIFAQITNRKSKPIGTDHAARNERQFRTCLKASAWCCRFPQCLLASPHMTGGSTHAQTACRMQTDTIFCLSMANTLSSFALGLGYVHSHSHQIWDFGLCAMSKSTGVHQGLIWLTIWDYILHGFGQLFIHDRAKSDAIRDRHKTQWNNTFSGSAMTVSLEWLQRETAA